MREWVRRRGRRQVRRMMRGYRRLRATDRLPSIVALKDRIARTPCAQDAGGAPAAVLQQYLLVHLAHERLQRALLVSAGTGAPLICPLPGAWRQALAAAGVPIDGLRCRLAWGLFVLAFFARGLARVALLGTGVIRGGARGGDALRESACFVGVGPQHRPAPGPDGRSFDVFTWYARWAGRLPSVRRLVYPGTAAPTTADDMPVVGVTDVLPQPGRLASARLLVWGLWAIVIAGADLLRGRWARAVLLSQAVQAQTVAMSDTPPAAEYLFHNSGWLYRPWWTYAAEVRGSRILFYFYSTNIETFANADGTTRQAHMWSAATWPMYLVWDEGQAAFIRREVSPDARIEVVGPIWFYGSALPMPPVDASAVAVFDVQAYRDFIYQVVVAERLFYTPDVGLAFLEDIRAVLAELGRPMVFKHKRHLAGHAAHGRYRRYLAHLQDDSTVVAIDPSIAANRVIECCAAVISMPFTSTALIARASGKPSIYYVPDVAPFDPVHPQDRAAHGIPVVSGRAALRAWLKELS